MQVTSKAGDSYNLGQLLETGTMPHAIPNAFGYGEWFGVDPNFHPGMKAYNNYKNALNFFITENDVSERTFEIIGINRKSRMYDTYIR